MSRVSTAFLKILTGLLLWVVTLPMQASEPYCGVYSLYTCAQALNQPVEFESLLENEYVIGWEGSSIESLNQAANDIGLATSPLQSLAHWDLRLASCPIILHVRSDVTRPNFDHWIAFLGEQDGKARVVDPSHGEQLVEYSDLLAIWDGAGLAVSDSKLGLVFWRWSGIALRILGVFCLAALLSVIFKCLAKLRNAGDATSRRNTSGRVALVFSILIVIGLALDQLTGSRVLSNTYAARTTSNLYTPIEFEEVSRAEVKRMLRDEDAPTTVLVDARIAQDYAYRSLPRAISIPVNCSVNEEAAEVESLSTDTALIVFCQSAGCTYSDSVAKRLNARGFGNIRIYRGGIVDWFKQSEIANDSESVEGASRG